MNPLRVYRRFRFELLLAGLVLVLAALALSSCASLGLTEQPQDLTERIAVAEASAQWAAKSLESWAQVTERDAVSGRLTKQEALARLDRIQGYLCDIGLAGGALPADCPARNAPTARGLLAEAGALARSAPAGAEHRLGLALTTIAAVRTFLGPYLTAQQAK